MFTLLISIHISIHICCLMYIKLLLHLSFFSYLFMKKLLFLSSFLLLAGCSHLNNSPVKPTQITDDSINQAPIACTKDAKVCPDGSSVWRIAPDCEFEACPDSTAPAKIVVKDVNMKDLAFTPAIINIDVGTQITWINNDTVEHDVIASDGSFWSELLQEWDVYTHIFDKAGTYDYNCSIHPMMKWVIIVK